MSADEEYTGYPELVGKDPGELSGFFPHSAYEVTQFWHRLESVIEDYQSTHRCDFDPPFQRAHVWTKKQQVDYVEYQMLGGELAKVLTFAAVGWNNLGAPSGMVLLDGKQRLEAVRAFIRGDILAFRRRYDPQARGMHRHTHTFQFRVVDLKAPVDILRVYLALNRGGTVHTEQDLAKAEALLQEYVSGVSSRK